MPRRIDIELTSSRDETWTWRAAGAREPRGTVPASLLPQDVKVGDVLRADAEFFIDGIELTNVVAPKGERREPERLELIGSGRDEPAVTTSLVPGGRGERSTRDRPPRDRRPGPERGPRERDGKGDGRDRSRSDRPRRETREGGDGRESREAREGRESRESRDRGDRPPRRARPTPPPMPAVERPKAKRLRPGRTHRKELLEALPEEQRPIAEQLFLGGIPAVRQAIEKQNAERKAAGESEIAGQPLLELAEKLVNRVRAADWRDRAEAALRDIDELDLRDLRSVVSAADAAARDDESRQLATTLREALGKRVEQEHAAWLAELAATLDVGRVVRALRVSSRPPKAGAPLPADLATRLIDATAASLTADASHERWIAVLEALAFSPVRDRVIPQSLPADIHDDLKATVARLGSRVPKIAHIFSIEPDRSAPRPSNRPDRRRPKGKSGAPKPEARGPREEQKSGAKGSKERKRPAKTADREPVETPPPDTAGAPAAEEAPLEDAPAAEDAPMSDAPATESAPAEDAPAADAPAAESVPGELAPTEDTPTDDAAPDTEMPPAEDAPAPELPPEVEVADVAATPVEPEPAPDQPAEHTAEPDPAALVEPAEATAATEEAVTAGEMVPPSPADGEDAPA